MPDRLSTRFAAIPLATKVIAALSFALLPLGVIALVAAFHNYLQLAYSSRVSLVQAIGIALPALMWVAAVVITSLGINHLAIRPLRMMRAVVERYAAGDIGARMAEGTQSSPELAELSRAFNAMADRVAGHAQATQDALIRQTALTREVHHRVKNNLQIVSSLLSLQARDASSPEVSEAYALIRQRVNALALVHRWMYQDEAAQGVELRSLLADLSVNLEHGFEGATRVRRVACGSARLSVGQDIALPIAFLVTELVAATHTDARIEATLAGGRGNLRVTSAGFDGEFGLAGFTEGSRRIIAGLARQLRSPLDYDASAKAFSISFSALAPEA